MSEGVKLTEASVQKINKVIGRVNGNQEALMYSTNNGNASDRPTELPNAILVYLLGYNTACRLFKSPLLWYRFSINEFYSNFAIPIQQSTVPDSEVIYQFKVQETSLQSETGWLTVPERLPTDSNSDYFKKFANVVMDGLKTLQRYQDKEMTFEFVNNQSKTTVGEDEFNMVQFTFKERTETSVYDYIRDRPYATFMINKVKYRRQRYSPEAGRYYTYGPPSKTLFINPFYFEYSNLYFSPNVRIPVTLLINPNAGAIPNAYVSGIIGTEAVAYNVEGLGYVVTNVARRINYPLYSNPVIVYEQED